MRVAAVALVLVVGAAVILAFANTLNSWVLGGLLGGLAALLLSVPLSLALFTLLARRHDARLRLREMAFEEEPEFAEDFYDEPVVYESELSVNDEDFPIDSRARYLLSERRLPVSDYLRLPPASYSQGLYEDDTEHGAYREPRNYPRQPRSTSRSLAREAEAQSSPTSQRPAPGETRRQRATHALAQHQSEALRIARQEAQQQQSRPRPGSGTFAHRPQESRSQFLQRQRLERQLRTRTTTSGASRPINERPIWSRQEESRRTWVEEEAFADDLPNDQISERYQHYPRRPSYPRQPRAGRMRPADGWKGAYGDEDELEEASGRSSRHPSEKMSGSLRNPLVRRAPYLYDDDPLRQELAQHLENERPLRRRSSLYQHYDEED